MKIFSAQQFYEGDAITIKKQQISSTVLMERAGKLIFDWLHSRMDGAQVPIHIFCGVGNNGGDGLVIGRLLLESGYQVNNYIVNFTDKRSKDFLIEYDLIKNSNKNWPILMTSENDFPEIHPDDIIIDAIFGIGLNRPPEGWVKKLITFLNISEAFKLAVDLPSGLYANKPIEDFNAIVKANHTITFQAPKLALFLPETAKFSQTFEVVDIGLNQEFLMNTKSLAQLFGKLDARINFKPRDPFSNKSHFGHTLLVGGSYGKIGAVTLASMASFKIGAGLVTSFIPKCGYAILQTAVPEAMVLTTENEKFIDIIDYNFKPVAIGLGMGLGTNPLTIEALKKLFKTSSSQLVIDADAINALSIDSELLGLLPKNSILTPHPGELKRLIGNWKNDYDKIEKTIEFSKKHQVIMLIKGAYTMIIQNDTIFINSTGNVGMATAGSGDVLTGMITGLCSQGYEPLKAALFGVYLHGSAGDLAARVLGKASLMASDIIEHIPDAYGALFEKPQGNQQEKTD
ncbi:MAG: NAD(P)H-hydrate dehydratase [Flavobacteriales bacterium]